MAGEPQVLDQRAGRLIQAADRLTSREYLERIPGQGQIRGCRIVQPLGAQWIQGYYPKGPGDMRDSRFASWADGQKSKAECEKVVLDWMFLRHSRAVARGANADPGPDEEIQHEADGLRGRGCGRGRSRGRGRGLGGQQGAVGSRSMPPQVKTRPKSKTRGRGPEASSAEPGWARSQSSGRRPPGPEASDPDLAASAQHPPGPAEPDAGRKPYGSQVAAKYQQVARATQKAQETQQESQPQSQPQVVPTARRGRQTQ